MRVDRGCVLLCLAAAAVLSVDPSVPMDALLSGDVVSAETHDLENMLHNERAIERIPDPSVMDAQERARGSTAVSAQFDMSHSLLGEGQSTAVMVRGRARGAEMGGATKKMANKKTKGPEKPGVKYQVSLSTGPQAGASTKTAVHIEIFGSAGGSGKVLLAKSLESGKKKIMVTASEVGEVTGVRLHNAHSDLWFCAGLDVQKAGQASPQKFAVNAWIGAPYQPSLFIVRDVVYELSVKTGSRAGAGTVGKQYITLFGEFSATKKLELKAGADSGFQSGAIKKIKLTTKDVGLVKRVQLESTSADYWLCDTINVRSAGHAYQFAVNKWVGFPSATLVPVVAEAKYIVRVKTGTKKDKVLGDAGTKGQVYIVIMGSLGKTRKRPLGSGFTGGKTKQVTIRAQDVGELQQIKLSTESKDSWRCESVLIQKGATNSLFTVSKWIGAPSMSPVFALKDVEYDIEAVTGKMSGAGSKGEVFITLFGTRGATRKKLLSATGFKKGERIRKVIRARNVGELTKVRLDSASKDSWFCKSINVSSAGDSARFMIESWLVSPQAAFVEKAVAVKYVFSVTTGMDFNAPTMSKPLATLLGTRGETHKLALRGKFRMGETDILSFWAADVGKLTHLKLESSSKDDWLCRSILVSSHGKNTRFNVQKWLKAPTMPTAFIAASVKYTITVRTGGGLKDGTRDTVYVKIFGSRGEIPQRPLKTGFSPGSTTHVTMNAPDVGQVTKIVLSAASATDDWYCEDVIISHKAAEATRSATFSIHRWLGARTTPSVSVTKDVPYRLTWKRNATPNKSVGATGRPLVTIYGTSGATKPLALPSKTEGNEKVFARNVGQIEGLRIDNENNDSWIIKSMKVDKGDAAGGVIFNVGKPVTRSTPLTVRASTALALNKKTVKFVAAKKNMIPYTVTVMTGKRHNAETKGSQYIAFVGTDGQTGNVLLGKSFLLGQTTKLTLKVANVGTVTAIKLSTNSRDGWFCSTIKVTQGDQKDATFSVNSWLNADDNLRSHVQIPIDIKYQVSIVTGKGKGADTKGVPRITVFGEDGATHAVELKKLSGAAAGSQTVVSFGAKDVGMIKKIRFTGANKDNWECDKVTLKTPREKSVVFAVKQWLAAPRMPLIEAVRVQEYIIDVNTGSRTDADTKGTVFITLYGEDGATRMHELKKGFQKSKKQSVKLQALDVGSLTKATLHTKSQDGWFVESLLVHRRGDAKKKATQFVFDRWVQHPEAPSVTTTKSVNYQIQVKTGMLPGAGSTGQFFLKVFGTHGETQRLPLATGFKKGATLLKKIRTRDVGRVEKVQLSTASSDGWLCESLQVAVNGKKTPFPASTWVQRPGVSSVDALAGAEYEITVRTGTVAGAGTKGAAYITLFGQRASTPKLLIKAGGIKRGAFETFRITSRNVGPINSVQLTMEDKDKWLCENVEIHHGQRRVRFRVNKYIGKPHVPSIRVYADSTYTFSVLTGSTARAASRAAVSVVVSGTLGTTRKLHLQTGFRRGATKVTSLQAADVGKVVRIHLETQDDDDIHLQHVGLQVVTNNGAKSQYSFVADKWLKAPLFPSTDLFRVVQYRVSVDTAATGGYGGSAYVSIFGTLGASRQNFMDAPFEASKSRDFTYWQPTVGQVTSVQLQVYNGRGQWSPTHVMVGSGEAVSVSPVVVSVAAAAGAVNVATKLHYTVMKGFSIVGASHKKAAMQTLSKTTASVCIEKCTAQSSCKSLIFDRKAHTCVLYRTNREVGFDFQSAQGKDYYEPLDGKKLPTPRAAAGPAAQAQVRVLDDAAASSLVER